MMTLCLFVGVFVFLWIIVGMGGIAFGGPKWSVDASLEPCPPCFVALTHSGEPFANTEGGGGVAFVLEGEIGVGAPDKEGSCGKDNVELGIDGAVTLEGDGPNDGYENCNAYLNQGSNSVGTTIVEQHMMEVSLVGFKRGITFGDATEHHT